MIAQIKKKIEPVTAFLTGKKKQGSPCWVLAKGSGIRKILPGLIGINVEKAVEITYKAMDNTWHSFIEDQDNFIDTIDGVPLFAHDVGNLFGPGITDSTVGSEYFYMIISRNVGVRSIEVMERVMDESKPLPWVKIAIVAVAALAIIYLWQAGWITSVLGDIVPQSSTSANVTG